jgi:hypothetical protein
MSKQIIVRRPPKGKRWIYVGSISAAAEPGPEPGPGSVGSPMGLLLALTYSE